MNSHLKKIFISILLTIFVFAVGCLINIEGNIDIDEVVSSYDNDKVNEIVYPHDEIISVNVEISEDDYNDLINNAIDKTYYSANITYNGELVENVAVRAKGNSSLRDVYTANGDRFSLNVDLDYYIDQDMYGITEFNLNNMFEDPSYMAEYLAYEALDSIDAVNARTTFVELSINDEYFGLYISVEEIDENFINNTYSYDEGNLYKPESTETIYVGADLAYIDDDIESYTSFDMEDNETVLDLITAIDKQEGLDEMFNVDGFLKYLAVSTYMIHLDSYQGGMFHNYYLYDNDGIYEWITWDLNMVFNGYPGSGMTDLETTEFLIDEPVKGEMSNYPLIEAIFSKEEYVNRYHNYLLELSENYLNPDNFEEKVNEIYDLIKDSVLNQSSSFYTYNEFEDSLYGDSNTNINIIDFIDMRTDNILSQLSGEIPSTNNNQGNGSLTTQAPMNNTGEMQRGIPQIEGNIPLETEMPLDEGNMPPIEGEEVPITEGNMPPVDGGMAPTERNMPPIEDDSNSMNQKSNPMPLDENIDESDTEESVISILFGIVLLLGATVFIKSRTR